MQAKITFPADTSLKQKIILIIFGLFLSLTVLETGLRLAGFILSSAQEYANRRTLREKGAYRIICLGESTTALGGEDAFPRQLEKILNARNLGKRFSVINKGIPAAQTNVILEEVEGNLERYRPDMVIAMIGANDGISYAAYDSRHSVAGLAGGLARFFKSLKIFKLAKLLRRHIPAKIAELRASHPGPPFIPTAFHVIGPSSPGNRLSPAEELNSAIRSEPANDRLYVELGRCYEDEGRYSLAEKSFNTAVKLNLDNDEAYAGLGWSYVFQKKYRLAEEAFAKVIGLNPAGNGKYYYLLGFCQAKQGKDALAKESMRKAGQPGEKISPVHLELTLCHLEAEEHILAQESFNSADVPSDAQGYYPYMRLGMCYKNQRRYAQAEKAFTKSLELNPGYDKLYVELAWCYLQREGYAQAEELFARAIERNPLFDKAYGGLAVICAEKGDLEAAEEYRRKADDVRRKYFNPLTHDSYRRLKASLDARGVKLVCVQYPMRSIEPLERIFAEGKGVVFVDNEGSFKQAVNEEGYAAYFTDIFAGEFGHCTAKGNRLLARNIADTIIREIFRE